MVYFAFSNAKTRREKEKSVQDPFEYHCSKCGHYTAKQNIISSLVKKLNRKVSLPLKKLERITEKLSLSQIFKQIYGFDYSRNGDQITLTDSFGKVRVFRFSDTETWMDYLKNNPNKAQIDIDGMVEMVQNYFRAQGLIDYINISVDFVFGLVNFVSWTVVAVHSEGKVKLAAIANAVTAITYIGWKIYYLTKQVSSLEENKNKIKAVMFAAVTSMISSRKDVEVNMEEALKGQGISRAEYDEAIEIVKKLVKETNLDKAEKPEELNVLPPMLIEGPKSAKATVVETKKETKPETSQEEVFEDAEGEPQEQKIVCMNPLTGKKDKLTEKEFAKLMEGKKVQLKFENKIFTDPTIELKSHENTGPPDVAPFQDLKAVELPKSEEVSSPSLDLDAITVIEENVEEKEKIAVAFQQEIHRSEVAVEEIHKNEIVVEAEIHPEPKKTPAQEFIQKTQYFASKSSKKQSKRRKGFSGAKAQSDIKEVTEPAPDWTSIAAKGFIWIVNIGAVVATSVIGGGSTVREALTHVQLAQTMNNIGRTAITDINDLKKTIYTTVTEPAIVQDVIIQEKITKAQQYISTPQVEIANNFDRYEDLCYFIDELKVFLGPNPSHAGISMELRTLNQLYLNLCAYLQAVNVQLNNSVVRPKPAAHHFFSPESGIGKTTCITQKFIPAVCAHLGKDANLASTVILDSTTNFIPPATRNCPGTFFDEFLRYGGECKVAAKLNSWVDTSRTVREGAALDTKNAPVSDRFTFFASNVPGVQLKGIPIHSQNATWGRLTQWKVVHTDLEGEVTFDQVRDRNWTRKDDFSNLRFVKYKYIPTLTEGSENDMRTNLVIGNSKDLYPSVGTMVNTTAGRYKILSKPMTADEVLDIIKDEMDENMNFYLKHKQQRELDKIQFETQIQSAKKEKISSADLSNRFIRTYETLDDILKVSLKSYPTSFNLIEAIRHEDPEKYRNEKLNFDMSSLEKMTNQSRVMYNAFKTKFEWKSISQDSLSLEENMMLQAYFMKYNVVFVAKDTYKYTFNPSWKFLYFSYSGNNILPLVLVQANAQIEIRSSAHGTSNPLTILFRGPPETGKTTLAASVMKRIAALYDMPVIKVTQNDLTRRMITTEDGRTIDVSLDAAVILVDDLVKEFPNVYASFWNTLNPYSIVFVCANLKNSEIKTLGAYSSFKAFSANGNTFFEAWLKSCPRWYRRSVEMMNGWNKANVDQNIRKVDIGKIVPDGWARRLGLVGKIYSGGGISDSPYNIELYKPSVNETFIIDPVTMEDTIISELELVEKINSSMVERQRLSKAVTIEKRPNLAAIKTDPLYKAAELTVECDNYEQFRSDFSTPSNIMWAVASGRVKLTKEMLEHPKLKISSSYNFVLKLSEEMNPEELKEQGIRLYELLDANGLDAAVFVRIGDNCIFVNKRKVLTTVINDDDKVNMVVEKDGSVILTYQEPKVNNSGGVTNVEHKVSFTPAEVWSILRPPHVAMEKPIVAMEHMKARVQELLKSDYYKKKEAIYQKEVSSRAKHIGYLKQGADAVNIVKSSPWYLVFKITSVVIAIIATIGTLSFLIYKATKSEKPVEEKKVSLTEEELEEIRYQEFLKVLRSADIYEEDFITSHSKKLYKQSPEERKKEYDSWREIRERRGINLEETSFLKDGKISFHQATAPKPQMVDTNMTCFYGTPAPIPEYIYREAEKNLVKVIAHYTYPNGTTEEGIGFGIMLKAADVIFPAHYIKRDPIITKLRLVNFDVGNSREVEYPAQLIALNRASEIAMARVNSNCPHFKDITSHFIKEEDTTAIGSIAVHRPHSGKWETLISASSVVRNGTNFVTTDSPGINLSPSKVMMVNFTHLGVGMSYGSCGIPYLWVNGAQCRFFTGFHIAGNTDSSFGCFITQETIKDLYSITSQSKDEPQRLPNEYWVVNKDQDSLFVEHLRNSGLMSHDIFVNNKQRELLENLSPNMNLPDTELRNVKPIGFSSYLFQMKAYKNKRTKVPWSSEMNDLVQNAKDHSLTTYYEGMDPKHYVYVNTRDGKKPCLKWAQIVKKEDPWNEPDDFKQVIEKGKEELARLLRRQDWSLKFRTLNEYEVLNGIQYGPLKGYLKSMNAGATVGAFWSKYHKCVLMKDKYIGYVDRMGTTNLAWQKTLEADELRYFIAEAEQHLYEGIRPLTFYGDELKVELNEGKSRLFSAADVVEKYLFRRFFGTLLAFESKFRHKRRTAIGADSLQDLPAFMWKARQIGSQGIFSDASRFDKHVLKYVIQQYYKVIVDFMLENWEKKELERIGEEKLRKAFDVMIDMVATPIHVVNGTIYVSNRGNPSGSPNTTITNCGVADLMICAWYMKELEASSLKPEQMDIDENIFVKMLGDDFFVVLSDTFLSAGLNGTSFSKFFLDYGSIELTSAKKDGPLEESLPLNEGSFLSRTFKPAGHNAIVWFPALKKSSIHSAMHFYTPGEERSLKEAYVESMKEAALHMDKGYYERVCEAVRVAIRYSNKAHGKWIVMKSVPVISYEKMISELEKEALQGIPMSQSRRDVTSTKVILNKRDSASSELERSECVPFVPVSTESQIKIKASVKHPTEQINRTEMSLPKWATCLEKNRYSSDIVIAALQICIDLAPCKSTVLVMSDSGQRWLVNSDKVFSCEGGIRSVMAHGNEFRCSGRIQDQVIATLLTKRWQRVVTQLSMFYPQYKVVLTKDFLQIGTAINPLPEVSSESDLFGFRECSTSAQMLSVQGQLNSGMKNFLNTPHNLNSSSFNAGKALKEFSEVSKSGIESAKSSRLGNAVRNSAAKFKKLNSVSSSAIKQKVDKKPELKPALPEFQEKLTENTKVEEWGGRPWSKSPIDSLPEPQQEKVFKQEEAKSHQNLTIQGVTDGVSSPDEAGRSPDELLAFFRKEIDKLPSYADYQAAGPSAQMGFYPNICSVCYKPPCSRCGNCGCGSGCTCRRAFAPVGPQAHMGLPTSSHRNFDNCHLEDRNVAPIVNLEALSFSGMPTPRLRQSPRFFVRENTRFGIYVKTGPKAQMQYDQEELFKAKPTRNPVSQKETIKQVHEQLDCAKKGISYVLPGGEVIGKSKISQTKEAKAADEHRMNYHRMEKAIFSKLASTMSIKEFRRVLRAMHVMCASAEQCTCFDLIQDIDDEERRSEILSYAIRDLRNVEEKREQFSKTGPKAHVGGAELAAAAPDQSQVASVPPPPSDVAVVGTSVGTLGNQQVAMQVPNMMERGGTMQDVASVAFNNKIPILDIVIPIATASGTLLWKAYCDTSSLSVYAKFVIMAHIRWMPSIELTAIFVGVATYAGLLQAVLTPVDTNLTGNLLEQFLYAFNWEMLHYSSTGEFGAVLNYNFFPGNNSAQTNIFWSNTTDVISNFSFVNNFRRGPCWWLRAATAFVQAFENPDASVLIKMFSRLGPETVMSLININFISTAVEGTTQRAITECSTSTSRVFDITGLTVKDLLSFVSGNVDFDIGSSPAEHDYYMKINGKMVSFEATESPKWNSMQWNTTDNANPIGKPFIFNDKLLEQTGSPTGIFSSPSTHSATINGSGRSLKTQGFVTIGTSTANAVYPAVSAMDMDMSDLALDAMFAFGLVTTNVSTRLDNFILAIQETHHVQTTRTGDFTANTTWFVEGTNRKTLAPFSFALAGNPTSSASTANSTRVINNKNVEQFTLPSNMYQLDFGPARPIVEGPGCLLQGFIDPVNSKLVSFMKKNFPAEMVTVIGLEDPITGSRKVFILFNPEQNCFTIQLSTNNPQGYNENQRSQQLYTGGNVFNHNIVSVTTVPKSNSLPYSDSSLWQTLTVSGSFSAAGPKAHAALIGAAISKSPVLNAANGGINYGFNSAYLKKQYQYNKDLLADYNKGQFRKEVASAGINAAGSIATSWNQRKGVENAAKTSAKGNVASALISSSISAVGNVAAVKAHGQENRKTQDQALQNSGTVRSGSLGISSNGSKMQVGTAGKRNLGSSVSSSTGLNAVRE